MGLSEAGMAQPVSSSESVPEDQKLDYQVGCYAETSNPKILISPDINKPIERRIGFDCSYSFTPDRIIKRGEIQYLGGTLSGRAGRVISKGSEFTGPDRDQLFVLSSEWHCQLYRGINPWPLHEQ